jgi:hypothetical protein
MTVGDDSIDALQDVNRDGRHSFPFLQFDTTVFEISCVDAASLNGPADTILEIRGRISFGSIMGRDYRFKEEQIVVGDIVRFKGGGSSMKVEKIEGDEAICVFALGGTQRVKLLILEKITEEHHWWDRE